MYVRVICSLREEILSLSAGPLHAPWQDLAATQLLSVPLHLPAVDPSSKQDPTTRRYSTFCHVPVVVSAFGCQEPVRTSWSGSLLSDDLRSQGGSVFAAVLRGCQTVAQQLLHFAPPTHPPGRHEGSVSPRPHQPVTLHHPVTALEGA